MSWQRLESTTVASDLLEGQEARVADPLWLLGRQWQVGEFKGEDAASPILLEAGVTHAPMTRLRPGAPDGDGPIVVRGADGLPLETAVEREPVRSGPAAARLAAEAGLQLLRHLGTARAPAKLAAQLRAAFPLKLGADDGLDPVGRAQLELLTRRACDARALALELERGGGALDAMDGIDEPAVRAALDVWAAWYGLLFSEPPAGAGAWSAGRMEYRFQVAAGVAKDAELQLDATEYTGGRLDWYAFDVAAEPRDMGARGTPVSHDVRVIPTPARYAGQAASRWWQLEAGAVSFADVQAAPEDLARVAVAAFGLTFGDDWYMVPWRLPSGVLVRAEPVKVIDTFGETHTIRSCAELDGPGRTWRWFELTGDASADAAKLDGRRCPWLLLPPALAGRTESRPVEEVAFVRDEAANLGWAAELRIESAAGRPVDRAALARAAMSPAEPPAGDAWRYTLSPPVPEHQVPLVPVRSSVDGALYLQRGRLLTDAADGVVTRGALGRILQPDRPLLIHDAEVPATGARVTRTWQMARSADGTPVVWMGRRKEAGRPRRSPGLVFDEVVQTD